jgi:hypothetical protein
LSQSNTWKIAANYLKSATDAAQQRLVSTSALPLPEFEEESCRHQSASDQEQAGSLPEWTEINVRCNTLKAEPALQVDEGTVDGLAADMNDRGNSMVPENATGETTSSAPTDGNIPRTLAGWEGGSGRKEESAAKSEMAGLPDLPSMNVVQSQSALTPLSPRALSARSSRSISANFSEVKEHILLSPRTPQLGSLEVIHVVSMISICLLSFHRITKGF